MFKFEYFINSFQQNYNNQTPLYLEYVVIYIAGNWLNLKWRVLLENVMDHGYSSLLVFTISYMFKIWVWALSPVGIMAVNWTMHVCLFEPIENFMFFVHFRLWSLYFEPLCLLWYTSSFSFPSRNRDLTCSW